MTNFTVSKSVSAGLLGLSVLLATSPAQALDLTTWTSTGDVVKAANQSTITNAFPGDDGAINFNVSPTAPVSTDVLESFLGLTQGALGATPQEGSAIKKSFTAQAGDQFSFDWNFLTNEPTTGGNPDFAFVTIGSGLNTLATIANATTSPAGIFLRQTGLSSFNYTFNTAGTYTIGIGVVDNNDFIASSALQIGNADYKAVPTPALLPALVGFGVAALRKRKQDA
jgi:hypothetical protein